MSVPLQLRAFKHGHSSYGKRSPEHGTWHDMKTRCFNTKHRDYKNYGARGITVCEEWRSSFKAFLAHIGPKPSRSHTIERINNDGQYEPGNVRWATRAEQNNNRRANRYLAYDDRTQTLTEWAREYHIDPETLASRLARGWSLARALSTPTTRR